MKEEYFQGLLMGLIIMGILDIIIIGIMFYGFPESTANYKDGFQAGVNSTLNNYTCTEKPVLKEITLNKDIQGCYYSYLVQDNEIISKKYTCGKYSTWWINLTDNSDNLIGGKRNEQR